MKVLVVIVSVLVFSEAHNNGYSNFNGYDRDLYNIHSASKLAANSYIQENAFSEQYNINNGYQRSKSSYIQNHYPETAHYSYQRQQPYTSQHSVHGNNQYIPILDKYGVPVETPEVQLAKQQHLQAHQHAKLRELGENVEHTQYNYPNYHSSQFYPSLTPSGVPEDTEAVKIAKAQHFAAHAAERAKHTRWEEASYNNPKSQYWQ